MNTRTRMLSASAIALVAALLSISSLTNPIAQGQKFTSKAPTAADWAALARLPDFTGVWEISPGPRAAASSPSLTPVYEAKRAAYLAAPPEDSETANCLPAGMPGIMGQPYP